MNVLILDFYVDEPACFGVPPYLSPYVRYTAGALRKGGLSEKEIFYLTVDQWREKNFELEADFEFVFVIAGSTVPGKYLGGKIGTVAEIYKLLDYLKLHNKNCTTLIGGPIRYASREIKIEMEKRNGILIRGDIESYAETVPSLGSKSARNRLEGSDLNTKRTYEDVDDYSVRGAFISNVHPNYPYLILEIETYRGCTRDIFCSFCTEAFYGKPVFRQVKGIVAEFAELYGNGNLFYRLGRQADLMTYLPYMEDFKNSFPRPNPGNLLSLYTGIRKAAPGLKLLHLDNINPGLIATFPDEAEEIAKIITDHNTEGDTAAMGIESVDTNVIQKNDLKCSPEEAMTAIRIINKYGQTRVNGIPKLLPGLNFIGGLSGEDENTFRKNFEFLQAVMEEGLLLRRINIRQVVKYEKTKLARLKEKSRNRNSVENKFVYYRDKIRKEIDEPMLKKTFPAGSILRNVIIEKESDGYYMGRQLGSYPITLKISGFMGKLTLLKKPIDVIVSGHSGRSLNALPYPIPVNLLTDLGFREIPGIGKNSASMAKIKGPFKNEEDMKTKIPEIHHTIGSFCRELVFY